MQFARHRKGRPPKDAREVLALTDDRKWIPDDGKKHRAFSYRDPDGWPYAIAQDCSCWDRASCPQRIASSKTCNRFGASNGAAFDDLDAKRKTR